MYNELINNASKDYPFIIKHTDVKYIPHFHSETEIVYVLNGELEFSIGTNIFTIKKGDICIIPAMQIHNLYTFNKSETFVMKLFPIPELENIYFEKNVFTNSDFCYNKLEKIVKEIINENDNKHEYYQLAVNLKANEIYMFILRELNHRKIDNRILLKHITENDFLTEINIYLEENFCDDINLSDIAGRFNYTKSYFCRYFKKITGMTFWEYFTMFRLKKSIELIKAKTDENITVIASKSGFNNVRSYNDSFKKYYHCTPSEYKKFMR